MGDGDFSIKTDADVNPATRARDVVLEGLGRPLDAGLYLVATPIGNLGDITLRALNCLSRADIIACEDTRHSRKLLSHFALKGRLVAYHEHNAASARPALLKDVAEGKSVALISDAGTPLISDPGYKLVEEARELGLMVTALPGASSPIVALTLSGLPTDRFFFEGFLPVKEVQRQKRLQVLKDIPASLVFFETPKRVGAALTDMAGIFGDRQAAVTRELTKRFETVVSGALGELAKDFSDGEQKGEFVIVVAPPLATEISDDEIAAQLLDTLREASFRDSVKAVSEMTGVKKSRVYEIGLKIKKSDEGEGAA